MGEGGISCALGVRSLIISEVEHPCLCLLAIRVFQSTSELLFMETLQRKGKASYTPRRVICHTQSRQRLSVKYICKKRTTHLIENRRNSWHFTETAPPPPVTTVSHKDVSLFTTPAGRIMGFSNIRWGLLYCRHNFLKPCPPLVERLVRQACCFLAW